MTISELGAIGEFIASIGVFVTLLILVVELKRNSKLLIRSNSREAYLHNAQALETLIDKEVSELFLRGNNEGLAALSKEERYRFDLAYVIWLQSCEQAFTDHKEGLFPSDQFAPIENSIAGFLSSPGGKDWWKERDVWFGHLFRQKVDSVLENYGDEAAKAGPVPKT